MVQTHHKMTTRVNSHWAILWERFQILFYADWEGFCLVHKHITDKQVGMQTCAQLHPSRVIEFGVSHRQALWSQGGGEEKRLPGCWRVELCLVTQCASVQVLHMVLEMITFPRSSFWSEVTFVLVSLCSTCYKVFEWCILIFFNTLKCPSLYMTMLNCEVKRYRFLSV